MTLPQTPPSWLELDHRLPDARRTQALRRRTEWWPNDSYLHWDALRSRPAPDGFTQEEWWYVLKLGRSGTYRPIALADTVGRPFVFGQPHALAALLHRIDRAIEFAEIPANAAEVATRERHVINALIEESIASAQLAGATTQRESAKEMLRSARPPRDRSEQMIANAFHTLQHVRAVADAPLTPEAVCDLHRRLAAATLDDSAAPGRLRLPDEAGRVTDTDGTILHTPPPAGELPQRLAALCAFANGDAPAAFVHPVVRGILLHFWLAYDHPFPDGNGRTARALFYWAMLRQGYPLFDFISISKALLRAPERYVEAFLHAETDDNDLTYFLLQQGNTIREAAECFRSDLNHEKGELRAATERLPGLRALNHRQQALLLHALQTPGTGYEIIVHQRTHGVTHQTARSDLFELADRRLLTRKRAGRRYEFRAPDDLAARLGHA